MRACAIRVERERLAVAVLRFLKPPQTEQGSGKVGMSQRNPRLWTLFLALYPRWIAHQWLRQHRDSA